jgi:hypothetical protein
MQCLLSTRGANPLIKWTIQDGKQLYLVDRWPHHVPKLSTLRKYRRDIKGYCFACSGATRLEYPRKEITVEPLINHRYLNFQVQLEVNRHFSIELMIVDSSDTQRRLLISLAVGKLHIDH